MAGEKPTVTAENAHFLKGHASWLYCDSCNQTVAYLCYVTYRYFSFSFTCRCGGKGFVENQYGDVPLERLAQGSLVRGSKGGRFACEHDGSALFSPVPGHLKEYRCKVVCNTCDTLYECEETF